jgi:hypothetical protein
MASISVTGAKRPQPAVTPHTITSASHTLQLARPDLFQERPTELSHFSSSHDFRMGLSGFELQAGFFTLLANPIYSDFHP